MSESVSDKPSPPESPKQKSKQQTEAAHAPVDKKTASASIAEMPIDQPEDTTALQDEHRQTEERAPAPVKTVEKSPAEDTAGDPDGDGVIHPLIPTQAKEGATRQPDTFPGDNSRPSERSEPLSRLPVERTIEMIQSAPLEDSEPVHNTRIEPETAQEAHEEFPGIESGSGLEGISLPPIRSAEPVPDAALRSSEATEEGLMEESIEIEPGMPILIHAESSSEDDEIGALIDSSIDTLAAPMTVSESSDDSVTELRKAVEVAYALEAEKNGGHTEDQPEDSRREGDGKQPAERVVVKELLESPDTALEILSIEVMKLNDAAVRPAKDALLAVIDNVSVYQQDSGNEPEQPEKLEKITEALVVLLDTLHISASPESAELLALSLLQADTLWQQERIIAFLKEEGTHESLQDNWLLYQLAHIIPPALPLPLALGRFAVRTVV